MHQSVLVVREPREAMISYHNLLYEIGYAKDWVTAYSHQSDVYTHRPPVYAWEAWRDKYALVEVEWWGWFIDFWMEGGLLRDIITHQECNMTHWDLCAISHEHKYPNLTNFVSPVESQYHPRCGDSSFGMADCHPTTVVSYERLTNLQYGPAETRKLTSTVEGKQGIEIIGEEAQPCVWRELVVNGMGGRLNDNRNGKGPSKDQFTFTQDQLVALQSMLEAYINKYSSGVYVGNTVAQDLVGYLQVYKDGIDNDM